MNKIICVSGGFDPLHVGHVRLIKAAAQHADVFVILNSDEWLKRKKGYVFMPYNERKCLLNQLKGVAMVSAVDDADGTVCEALIRLKPDMFGNGGDRTAINTPEMAICQELDINMVWNLGGQKIQSSSGLINTLFFNKPMRSELADFQKIIENLP